MRIAKQIVLVFVLAALAGSLAACNTVKGAGKDLKQGGEAIENAADRASK